MVALVATRIATGSEGEHMKALVLLSGGLDSTAAALFAVEKYKRENVFALAFGYGQSHRDAELAASQTAAERIGIAWDRLELGDALRGGVVGDPPRRGTTTTGASRATTAARNLVFLSLAAHRAGWAHPNETTILVVGFHRDDAEAFADCRADFAKSFEQTSNLALRGVSKILVEAPWITHRKSKTLETFKTKPESLAILRDSVSCYAGTRCGACDACSQRAEAFAAAEIEDGTRQWVMTGGDPHRQR
jgi:7-cyano-7-deazaguanine synthase